MAKLLTEDQAVKLVRRAAEDPNVINGVLRFGQNLWNLMYQDHPDLTDSLSGSPADFFYDVSRMVVFEKFFGNFVEGETK